MAFSGGIFSRLYNFVSDRDNGIKIRADRMDSELDGIASGLSAAILKDGSQTITANIPFATYRITGLGDPSAAEDAATKNYVDTRFADNVFNIYDSADNTKVGAFDASSIATGTTRTYLLPNANGALALTSDIGTTFADNAFRVQDNSDATKQWAVELSGITTATTRTWTVPDADITFGAYTSTLLNVANEAAFKAAVNLDADIDYVAVDGPLVSIGNLDIVQGDIIYASGTDIAARLPKGPANHVLTMNSGATAPEWAAIPSATLDVQEFTASGTWHKPSAGGFVCVICIGGGGGGGSGRRGAAGTNRCGGGGGSGGGHSVAWFALADLGSTETVTVGAGGSGGAAQTSDDTDGSNGAAGGDTTFGSILFAGGGNNGNAGQQATSASGGSPGRGNLGLGLVGGTGSEGQGGQVTSSSVGHMIAASDSRIGWQGSGSGGAGVDTGNTHSAGGGVSSYHGATGTASLSGGASGGGSGSNGITISKTIAIGGSGGGGNNAGAGGGGGNGATPGGGGGGGGGCVNGNNSGAGGDGGNGYCLVITY